MSDPAIREKQDLGIPIKVHSRDPATLKPLLETLLSAKFPDRKNLQVSGIDTPSGAGVNNETLLLDLQWHGGTGGAVLRIDTDDNLFLAPGFPDHFRLYRIMHQTGAAPVPEVFGLEMDLGVLGRPFFLMERMHGDVPADQPMFHASGWMHGLAIEDRATMWRNAVTMMARLHATPLEQVSFLARPALGASGLEQELNHAFDYMDWALGGERHLIIEAAADWLKKNFPADPATSFAWGDARPQNIMFRDNEVVALFDWDMASLGGPEVDLAWWSLMDLSSTVARDLGRISGWGSPAETIALWEACSGRRLRNMEWHFVFAAFRGAIIVMRLAKMLIAKNQLPASSADLKDNNIGIQFLASMLGLKPMAAINAAWPGPAA